MRLALSKAGPAHISASFDIEQGLQIEDPNFRL